MKIKYYLRSIKHNDDIINAKLEQIENLRNSMCNITSDMSSERVQTSNISDLSETVSNLIDLQNELTCDVDNLVNLKRMIINEIDQLDNCDYKALLHLRYLNFKSWEEIAVIMGYSYRNVHYIHERALIAFETLHTFAHNSMV